MSLNSSALAQSQSSEDDWFCFNKQDAGALLLTVKESSLLKQEVILLNKQKELDEKEKRFLQEKIDFEKEKVAIVEIKVKATQEAMVGINQINQDQKGVIRQLEKDVRKAKWTGYLGIGVGVIIAICAVVLAL